MVTSESSWFGNLFALFFFLGEEGGGTREIVKNWTHLNVIPHIQDIGRDFSLDWPIKCGPLMVVAY